MKILISFLPWILYGIISDSSYFYAIIAAFVATLVISIPNIIKKNIKILDIGTFVYFLFMFIVAITPDLVELEHWTFVLSSMALFSISFISIIIRKPFTIQYAKETVDEKYWETPGFIRTNYIISGVWTLGFALTALCAFISLEWLEYKTIFSTYIPTAITFINIMFTKKYPEYVTAKALKQRELEQQDLQNIDQTSSADV